MNSREKRTGSAAMDRRPRWVDVRMLADLEKLAALVHEAIISVHRINAINTVGLEVSPWTEAQFDWVEREHLVHIGQLARCVAPERLDA